MPNRNPDDPKQLYEFDNTYLKKLNQIRKDLNLLELNDEETTEETSFIEPPASPSPRISFAEELYSCSSDYLTGLNNIRRQLNLKEIPESSKESKDGNENSDKEIKELFVCNFENKGPLKKFKKPKKGQRNQKVEAWEYYTPPNKKICVRENSPEIGLVNSDNGRFRDYFVESDSTEVQLLPPQLSQNGETSSPIKSDFHTMVKAPDFGLPSEAPFCSLNVPETPPKPISQKSKVTILVDEEIGGKNQRTITITDERSPKERSPEPKVVMHGLDLPRLSKEFYNFPSVVHIGRWAKTLNRDEKQEKSRIFCDHKVETLPDSMDQKPGMKLVEVETISSLNSMYHFRRKRVGTEVEEATGREESLEVEEKKKKNKCGCFSLCFVRKKKNYFS